MKLTYNRQSLKTTFYFYFYLALKMEVHVNGSFINFFCALQTGRGKHIFLSFENLNRLIPNNRSFIG